MSTYSGNAFSPNEGNLKNCDVIPISSIVISEPSSGQSRSAAEKYSETKVF